MSLNVLLPTTQETTLHIDITRWLILKSDWLYSLQPKMETLCTVSENKTGSGLSGEGAGLGPDSEAGVCLH